MRSTITIRTNDGTQIWMSSYIPEKNNLKVLIIAPAVGLTQEYYYLFACFFRQQGYTILTFDYRGVGKSVPQSLKGYEANMHQWAVQDINAVLLYAKHHYPNQEIIYIGHSIGGEIIGLAPASQFINRLILVSSALSCNKLWPLKDKIKMIFLKIFIGALSRLFGYFPGKLIGVFGNLPKGVIYEWTNWCENPNGLFDSLPDNNYRKLNIPILAYTFSDDWHCPPRAVKELLNHFANGSITWYHMKPKEVGKKKIGHIDFFLVSMRSTLWKSLAEWLNKGSDGKVQNKFLTANSN
jgi:predicted alpha/beta hydrolase